MTTFNAIRDKAHAASRAAGWYSNLDGTPKDRNKPEMIALIHSEISEAWAGFMASAKDDHLPHRLSVEVELADVLIRLGDFAGFLDIDVDRWFTSPSHDAWMMHLRRPGSIARLFMELHGRASEMLEDIRKNGPIEIYVSTSKTVRTALFIAYDLKCDIDGAIADKMEYNSRRADHKLEARAQAGGKAF